MKLLLLEQNKDKKGTLLETIVKVLLEYLGYKYVNTNEIGNGGNEIDVLAEKQQNVIGGTTTYPLICECKAHESPICMNDWLKFLGKVYKEKRNNSLSSGLMIALSDANGNVKGDIRNTNYQDDARLLTGSDLIEPIKSYYRLCSYSHVAELVKCWTSLTLTDCDIAFYENTPYWIVYFSNGNFSVLDKNGDFLKEDILNSIITAFSAASTYSFDKYIDIRKDRSVYYKKKAIKDIAIWALMSGPLSYNQILEEINRNSGGELHVEGYEVDKCLKELDFVKIEGNKACLKPIAEINMIEFYKTVLGLGIPTKLYNKFYIDHIDDSLLKNIMQLHDNLVLNREERKAVLFILKHSPSALRMALYPNPLFAPKSKVIGGDTKALKESIKSSFIQTLANCLEVDADSDIAMLLFDRLELRDFYKQTNYHIVLKDGSQITIPVVKRLYYIPFEEESGGVVIQASHDFVGKYDPKTGYMVGGKKKNQEEKTFFGIVKHKTGVDEEYLSIFA